VPSIFSTLLTPDARRVAPPPAEVNLRRVVLVGIALWGVALAVFAVLHLTDVVTGWHALAICGAGLVLGLIGLAWTRLSRRI